VEEENEGEPTKPHSHEKVGVAGALVVL